MIQPIAASFRLYELLTIPKKSDHNRLKSVLSKISQKEHILFTNKGRDAIYFALKDMNLKKTDQVILQGYTCSIVREAVKAVATPIFVDIDIKTMNMDLNKLKKAITKKTKAILVVHSYGNPVDMNFIMKLAKKHKLKIIEDCAQALKAKFNNQYVGSFGDYTIFTFGFSKDITIFKTGALLSKKQINPIFKKTLKPENSFRTFIDNSSVFGGMLFIESMPLFIRNILTKILVKPYVKGNQEIFEPSNQSPSNYAISFIYKQIKRINKILNKRKQNADFYNNELKRLNFNSIKLLKIHKLAEPTYFRYTFIIKNRKEVINKFLKNKVRLGALYDFFIAPKGLCPISELVSEQMINLPVHHKLKKHQLRKIVKLVKRYIK